MSNMNDFHRSNKLSGIHWLKNPIEELSIRIRLKPLDAILALPKFEDYINETNTENLNIEQNIEEYLFKWQQKIFSKWEENYYSDFINCSTDREIKYNEMLKNGECKSSKVFTYIHEDFHLPLPADLKKTRSKSVLNLNSCMKHLSIHGNIDNVIGGDLANSVSQAHLLKSEENIFEEQWMAMHVIFDNSDYNEDSSIIIKREVTLLSIYYNLTHNYMTISPDSNNLVLNPYLIENELGVSLSYQYEVDVSFEDEGEEELLTLLTKLHKKWERKHRNLMNFVMPPLGKRKYHLALEILSAVNFDMDNLYIEYTIKIPESIQCKDNTHGRTHVSEALRFDQTETWNYGHIIELNLDMDAGKDPPPIKFFFEVISTDWWCRHRTEGYGYLALTLEPGRYAKQLSCSRPEEKDKLEADNRRFFIGGCHLIKDLEVLAEPQSVDANFIYHTTGTISLRWSVISQSPLPGPEAIPVQPGTSSASALLLGAETALRKYRKARARLAAATKDLDVKYEEMG
ncbi:Meckel syndrome type 1 protein [Manduca sexta]|uniref:Meckel syndrome type 1 protein n=1 Tax=Manduca sexta TaxID=7130 RepID=A0A921YPI4_MANSE|nr:Meckel syndrome type 1 protein [Manduca sexta]KAG6443024.1 hypothetical protein O3G_MSEX002670 [Manduca sexta]